MAHPGTLQENPPQHRPIPPLEPGDQLSRAEFERRYEAMPHLKKAELIEGEVIMPSPVRWKHHGSPHADFITWLGTYRAQTPGTSVGNNASIRLDLDSEPQPDAALLVLPEFGGQVEIDDDDSVVGGPELIGEIAASSASIDLAKKYRVYRQHNVREYIVWRVRDETIDWFVLRETEFERLALTEGIYRSEVFPGLWLDAAAMVAGNLAQVLQVLQQGIATTEHAAFVAQLQKKQDRA